MLSIKNAIVTFVLYDWPINLEVMGRSSWSGSRINIQYLLQLFSQPADLIYLYFNLTVCILFLIRIANIQSEFLLHNFKLTI